MSSNCTPITTPITPEILFGALELERTEAGLLPHRLPRRPTQER